MGTKKMGRPTDSPKDTTIKFRSDQETLQKLKECSEMLEISQSEVLRRGIQKIHDGLKK